MTQAEIDIVKGLIDGAWSRAKAAARLVVLRHPELADNRDRELFEQFSREPAQAAHVQELCTALVSLYRSELEILRAVAANPEAPEDMRADARRVLEHYL